MKVGQGRADGVPCVVEERDGDQDAVISGPGYCLRRLHLPVFYLEATEQTLPGPRINGTVRCEELSSGTLPSTPRGALSGLLPPRGQGREVGREVMSGPVPGPSRTCPAAIRRCLTTWPGEGGDPALPEA